MQLGRLDGEADISNNADLSASEAVGPLTISTRSRNITLDRIAGNVSVTNRNGFVNVTSAPPLGNVTIENRNGSVTLTVPEHSSFSVDAETTNGELDNDFSLPTQGSDTHKNFTGTIGTSGPTLRITTSQGDVALKKSAILPLPPTPPEPPKLTLIPPDAKRAIKDAKIQVRDAARQVKAAQVEATQEAKQAAAEAKAEATADAKKAAEARREATQSNRPDGNSPQ
jgi:hypothetical protein